MWEILAFFRVVAVFLAFFVLLPSWARGARAGEGPAGRAATFVRFCFFVEVAVVLLGLMGLALPGALVTVCFVWLALDLAQREPALLAGPAARRDWLITRLSKLRAAGRLSVTQSVQAWRWPSGWSVSASLLAAAALAGRAAFPVFNARFLDMDDYARSLSLAVLSNGHHWAPDFSVPLVLPLQYFAAITAPRAVALSGPFFAAALIVAIGFAVYQLRACRIAALAAMGSAVLVMLSPLTVGVDGTARAELSVLFLILAIGLHVASRFDAMLSVALGVAVGLTHAHLGAWLEVLIPYASCLLLGVGIAEFQLRISAGSMQLAAGALPASLVLVGLAFPNASLPDGPIQYEEAAQLAARLADEQPRNAWALVSTTQELPYVYGSGWHVELASFVNDMDLNQVSRPSFRFPIPVREVYFLVEAEPLIRGGSLVADAPLRVRLSPTPSAAYGTPLERATLEFKLAELLSAYRAGHDDLEVVYRSGKVTLLRAPGSAPDGR